MLQNSVDMLSSSERFPKGSFSFFVAVPQFVIYLPFLLLSQNSNGDFILENAVHNFKLSILIQERFAKTIKHFFPMNYPMIKMIVSFCHLLNLAT